MKCLKDIRLDVKDSYVMNASVVVMLKDFWEQLEEEKNPGAVDFVVAQTWKCLRKSCKYITIRDAIVGLRKLEVLLISKYLEQG